MALRPEVALWVRRHFHVIVGVCSPMASSPWDTQGRGTLDFTHGKLAATKRGGLRGMILARPSVCVGLEREWRAWGMAIRREPSGDVLYSHGHRGQPVSARDCLREGGVSAQAPWMAQSRFPWLAFVAACGTEGHDSSQTLERGRECRGRDTWVGDYRRRGIPTTQYDDTRGHASPTVA